MKKSDYSVDNPRGKEAENSGHEDRVLVFFAMREMANLRGRSLAMIKLKNLLE